MRALVVPTNRPDNYRAFWHAWSCAGLGLWDHVVVVEDAPHPTPGLPGDEHVCWQTMEKDLRDQHWIFSRRDSAIRSYGFWRAFEAGATEIFTLDDDCFPVAEQSLMDGHLQNLYTTPRWTSSVPDLRTRGLPYFERGILHSVMISHGLWRGIPDIDAVQTLAGPAAQEFVPPRGRHVVPHGQYMPLCGMNLAFTRAATPLMYFPLMGEGTPYRRFDDIWCGVIAKKVCDHLGWHIVTGEPHIEHLRASHVLTNLVKEAPGIARNESFWQDIDQIHLTEQTATGCMRQVGEHCLLHADPYLQKLGQAICLWTELFPCASNTC